MVATRRKTREEETVKAVSAPTPQVQQRQPSQAGVGKRDIQQVIQQGELKKGNAELNDQELLARLQRAKALGQDVDDDIAVLENRIQSQKEETALELRERGAIKDGTPEKSIEFLGEPDLLGEGRRENLPSPALRLVSQIPGVEQFLQTVLKDQGLTQSQMKKIRELNPERADQLERAILNQVVEDKSRSEGQKYLENVGAAVEAFPIVGGSLSGSLNLKSPRNKIRTVERELGRTDTFLDAQKSLAKSRPDEAISNINDKEQRLLELEAKIQILILQSGDIQSDPAQIEDLEQLITTSYTKLNDARDQVALSIAQEQQGIEDPDIANRQLLNDLKRIS